MDDFDSSDIDFGPPDIDPRDQFIGQKSIDAIIASAAEDRIQSKRTIKNLQFGCGAPNTRQAQKMWQRRFEAFREHALGVDPTLPFTGLEVIRFLDSIINKIKPSASSKPVPSVKTIQRAYQTIIEYGVFTWSKKDGFQITRQDGCKIKTFLDDAVKAGRLTKGSWHERTWIGFITLSRMVRAFLEHCLAKGCPSWDFPVAKCLSVTLIAALGARSGDVTRSYGYKGTEYLQYRDIKLYIDGQAATFENLRAEVTLQSTKGHKDVMNDNVIFYLRPLKDAEHHHICPMNWLLVHVLRHGLVYGNTLEEVLSRAFARPDHRVEWRYPTYPVLTAFMRNHRPMICDLEKPALPHQVLSTIKEMGLISNILGRVYMHATRAGAIREVAHLPSSTKSFGLTTDGHRQMMGHKDQHITERYIGGHTMEVFNARAANKDERHMREPLFSSDSAMEIVNAPITQQDIQEWDERTKTSDGLPRDLSQKHVKLNAWRSIRRERLVSFNKNAMPENRFQPRPQPRSLVALAESSASAINAGRFYLAKASTRTAVKDSLDLTLEEGLDESEVSAVEDSLDSTLEEDLDEIEVSAVELEHLQEALFPSQAGPDEEGVTGTTTNDAEIDEEASRLLLSLDDETGGVTSENFIHTYARINVVCLTSFRQNWAAFKDGGPYETTIGLCSVRGNSRDEPSPWIYHCQKTPDCLFETLHPHKMTIHQYTCDESNVAIAFPHLKHLSDLACSWPARCQFPDCKSEELFNMPSELYQHLVAVHRFDDLKKRRESDRTDNVKKRRESDRTDDPNKRRESEVQVWVKHQSCVIDGCESGLTYFKHKSSMVTHLARGHKLSKEEAALLVDQKGQLEPRYVRDARDPSPQPHPNSRSQVWVKYQSCVIDGCESGLTYFSKRQGMLQHLTFGHKLSKEEATLLVDQKGQLEPRDVRDARGPSPQLHPNSRSQVWVKHQPCVIDGCESGMTYFQKRQGMLRHLIRGHKLSKEEAAVLIDQKGQLEPRDVRDARGPSPQPPRSQVWVKHQSCVIDGCESGMTYFPKRQRMLLHLIQGHKLSKEEAAVLIDQKGQLESRDVRDARGPSPQPPRSQVWVKHQPCVIDGCESGMTYFPKRQRMLLHLIQGHKLSKEEAAVLIDQKGQLESRDVRDARGPSPRPQPSPKSRSEVWDRYQPCVIDSCGGGRTYFKEKKSMVSHLIHRHGLLKEEATILIDKKGKFEPRDVADIHGPSPLPYPGPQPCPGPSSSTPRPSSSAPRPSSFQVWVEHQPCVVDGCMSGLTYFPIRQLMLSHLIIGHKLSKEDATVLINTKASFASMLINSQAPENVSRKRCHSPE